MKYIATLLLFLSQSIFAATPLDMKLGYWEYKTDLGSSPMMKQALASLSKLPKTQRDQVMKKMGMVGGVKKTYNCFTTEDMKNWEEKISGKANSAGCKMIVSKSTKTQYQAIRKCKNEDENIQISVTMKNNKSGNSVVTMPGVSNSIKSEMTWISSSCTKKK